MITYIISLNHDDFGQVTTEVIAPSILSVMETVASFGYVDFEILGKLTEYADDLVDDSPFGVLR